MKNHAVSNAAWTIIASTLTSPKVLGVFRNWFPICTSMPGVTPKRLGFGAPTQSSPEDPCGHCLCDTLPFFFTRLIEPQHSSSSMVTPRCSPKFARVAHPAQSRLALVHVEPKGYLGQPFWHSPPLLVAMFLARGRQLPKRWIPRHTSCCPGVQVVRGLLQCRKCRQRQEARSPRCCKVYLDVNRFFRPEKVSQALLLGVVHRLKLLRYIPEPNIGLTASCLSGALLLFCRSGLIVLPLCWALSSFSLGFGDLICLDLPCQPGRSIEAAWSSGPECPSSPASCVADHRVWGVAFTWVQLLECTFQALMGPLAVRHQASLMGEVGPAKQRPIFAHQCSIQQAFGPKSASAVFPTASESPPPPPGTGSPPAGWLRSQRPPIPSEPPLRPLLTPLDPGLELSLEPCLWSGPGSRA